MFFLNRLFIIDNKNTCICLTKFFCVKLICYASVPVNVKLAFYAFKPFLFFALRFQLL